MDEHNPKELPVPVDMLIEANETDGIVASGMSTSIPKKAFFHWSRGLFVLAIGLLVGIVLGGSVLFLATHK
jgi:hypothetical protein